MNNENEFTYEYSAERQKEIQSIRQKYSEPKAAESSKLDELRRLDKSVDNAGTAISIAAGIAGFFIFGFGMCCTLEWSDKFFVFGVVMGIIGLFVISAAYPINNFMISRKRKKLAPQILKLTEELLGGKTDTNTI